MAGGGCKPGGGPAAEAATWIGMCCAGTAALAWMGMCCAGASEAFTWRGIEGGASEAETWMGGGAVGAGE